MTAYGRSDLCMTVQNGYAAYGTNVAMYVLPHLISSHCIKLTDLSSYCFSNDDPNVKFQLWDADNSQSGTQNIKLHGLQNGVQFCLDSGEGASNGSGVSIQACNNGISNSQWNYSGINKLSINNGTFFF